MNDKQSQLFFFNASTGEILDSEQFIPEKRGNLFLVLNRSELFFNEVSIGSKRKVKTSDILAIQKNFIPLSPPYSNIIYKIGNKERQKFIFWVGNVQVAEDVVFYDEIPETLLFKGDPKNLEKYRLFVFKRISGFEIIYFDKSFFYSFFERDENRVAERVIALRRKFSLQGRISVLSDISLPNVDDMEVDLVEREQPYFFLFDYFPMSKIFSNISQHKRLKKVKKIVKLVNVYMNILLVFLLLLLGTQALFHFVLQSDKKDFNSKWDRVHRIVEDSDRIEWGLKEIKARISSYPNHFQYLKTIHEALDDDSFLLHLTLLEERISLEGFSKNSLAILSKLGKSLLFSKVSFKSPVKKNIYSQTERFFIDIELKQDG